MSTCLRVHNILKYSIPFQRTNGWESSCLKKMKESGKDKAGSHSLIGLVQMTTTFFNVINFNAYRSRNVAKVVSFSDFLDQYNPSFSPEENFH